MTNPHQPGKRRKFPKLLFDIWRAQIDPAHNSLDDWRTFGELPQPLSFLKSLACLDRYASIEAGCFQFRRKIRRQEGPPNGPLWLNPWVLVRFIFPEVLMS